MKRAMTVLSATLLACSVALGSSTAFARSPGETKIWKKPYRQSYYYNTYPILRGPLEYRPFVFYPPAPFGFGEVAALRAFARMP